jgi:hypothetical protein
MKRLGFFGLFSLLVLLAGPFTYFVSTVVVFNAVRGLFLFVINIFDMYDFSFFPNLIVGAICLGAGWLLLHGGVWLWRRVLPEDPTKRADFQRASMIAALGFLVATTAFAVVVTVFLQSVMQEPAFYFDFLLGTGTGPYFLLVWSSALYMPASWAVFVLGFSALEYEEALEPRPSRLAVSCLLIPPVFLIVYVILQWINGNIF